MFNYIRRLFKSVTAISCGSRPNGDRFSDIVQFNKGYEDLARANIAYNKMSSTEPLKAVELIPVLIKAVTDLQNLCNRIPRERLHQELDRAYGWMSDKDASTNLLSRGALLALANVAETRYLPGARAITLGIDKYLTSKHGKDWPKVLPSVTELVAGDVIQATSPA